MARSSVNRCKAVQCSLVSALVILLTWEAALPCSLRYSEDVGTAMIASLRCGQGMTVSAMNTDAQSSKIDISDDPIPESSSTLLAAARERDALACLENGNAANAAGRIGDGIAWWRRAEQLRPDSNVLANNIANVFMSMGNLPAALREANRAVNLGEDALALVTQGNVYKALKQYREALSSYEKAAQAQGSSAYAFAAAGLQLYEHGDWIDSADLLLEAIDRHPSLPAENPGVVKTLWNISTSRAVYYMRTNQLKKVQEWIDTAEHMSSHLAVVGNSESSGQFVQLLSNCLGQLEQGSGAINEECIATISDKQNEYFRMMIVRVMNCDWREREADESSLLQALDSLPPDEIHDHFAEWKFECEKGLVCGVGSPPPLYAWGFDMTPKHVQVASGSQRQDIIAKLGDAVDLLGSIIPSAFVFSPFARLRVGLLSGDLLRNHAVGNMMQAAMRLMDFSSLQVTLYATTEQQPVFALQENNGKRWLGNVNVENLHGVDPLPAATIMNSHGIHVLYDLSGYTSDHRQALMMLRPGFAQVHYHGYVGTLGQHHMDFYLADKIIAPPEHAIWWSESLVFHPLSFLGPSHRHVHPFTAVHTRTASADKLSLMDRRVAQGLPASGRTLCYFNQHFKIDPKTFAHWMSVMHTFEDVTLWLLQGNVASERNLIRNALEHGVSANRLVFANRADVTEHLARASLCDVAVDSPMYNSGATAGDTLYAGVPIVTVAGNKAIGRMLASMIRGTGLGDVLVARDYQEAEAIIQRLLSDRDLLFHIKQKLGTGIRTGWLYDVSAWTAYWDQSTKLLYEVKEACVWQTAGTGAMDAHTNVEGYRAEADDVGSQAMTCKPMHVIPTAARLPLP